jgi:iron-sulfur cluster repair protein YtfE (RIC family)
MHTITQFMSEDHQRCDNLYAGAEAEVAADKWDMATRTFAGFRAAMARHFAMEEEVLFPAFETRTGNAAGPTQVMRMEHEQMRSLLDGMRAALDARNADAFLGDGETLLVLMQQHNLKEEQILYPMTDRVLEGEREALLERLAAMPEGL